MNVFILATRISGNDGVTLEAKHWKNIFKRLGHKVTFVAGQLDSGGILMPELHFQHPDAVELYDKVIYGKNSYKKVEAEIFAQAGLIEGKLRSLIRRKKIDLLIIPNVLSLPMHFAFAVALARLLAEINIPTIARHHDFWWERKRFQRSSMFHFYERFFPPLLSNIAHVVINSIAAKEFKKQTNIEPTIIWDTIDFSRKFTKDSFAASFRKDLGIAPDDKVFLQATRLIPRKRIELAIKLVEKLNDPKSVLVIAGHAGDEGVEYEHYLKKVAKESNARVLFIGEHVNSTRRVVEYKVLGDGLQKKRIYTLWDCYLNADFVTYPSNIEGFGNQLVEAIYFKKPVIMTPYPVYESDIKPLGFKTLEMPEKLTNGFITKLKNKLEDKDYLASITDHNFELGKKYLSYDWSEAKILTILNKLQKGND